MNSVNPNTNYVDDECYQFEIIANNLSIKSLFDEITKIEPNYFDHYFSFSYVDIIFRDLETLSKYLNYDNKNPIEIDDVKYLTYNFAVEQDNLLNLISHITDLFNIIVDVNNYEIDYKSLLIERSFYNLFYDKFDTENFNFKYYNKWKIKNLCSFANIETIIETNKPIFKKVSFGS